MNTQVQTINKAKILPLAIVGTMLAATLAATGVFAAPGGSPAVHGVSGGEWGAAVSGFAKSSPGALAQHTSAGKSGGAPAAHGLSGSEWASAVNELAQTGMMGVHASGR